MVAEETICLIIRKIKTIFPYYLFAFITSIIAQTIVFSKSGIELLKAMPSMIWELMLLHQLGFWGGWGGSSWVGGSWYLSAMMIVIMFTYPFLLKYKKTYIYIAAPCAVTLCIGYLFQKYGYLHITGNWNGYVYDSLIRAICDINLGVVSYALSEHIRRIPFTRRGRKVLSIIGFSGYFFAICSSFFTSWGKTDFIWLLFITWSVAITGSEAGSLCRHINSQKTRPFVFLGMYSMALYMNHLVCYHIVNRYFPFLQVEVRVGLFCVMGLAAGLICILFVNQITNVVRKYSYVIKSNFLEK